MSKLTERLYLEKDEHDKAIVDFDEAIRLDPSYCNAYFYRGLSHAKKKQYDRAIADFTEAIRLDPKDAGAYVNRGLAYRSKGNQTKAEADFAKAKAFGYEPE